MMFRCIQALFVCLAGFCLISDCKAQDTSRTLHVSGAMPEFSAVDRNGSEFQYDPGTSGALLVLYYSPGKPQSAKAVEDIAAILKSLGTMPQKLLFVAVSDDPNTVGTFDLTRCENLTACFAQDTDFHLWGKFGLIASPTVFLAAPGGRIELIKAGYGYDFAPAVKLKLMEILGLASEAGPAVTPLVKTVTNDSSGQKADRHLKLARLLEDRGDYESALAQLKTAVQMDPNATGAVLELARLYCVTLDPNKALQIAQGLAPSDKHGQALRAYVLGKASAQVGDPAAAEKYLLQAVEMDPQNSRALYELGKIYQARNENDRTIWAFRRALDIIFADRR